MGQYFDNDNLKSNISKYKTKIFDIDFCFNTDNGVFSKNKLDFGSRVLLENMPINEIKGKVLEIGCGYGVIPIILSKVSDASFDAVDINKRALHLAKMNANDNNCVNINFFESNCYEKVKDKYNVIISNPPIRAGKKVVYEILMNAKNYLFKDGILFVVINKDQGAKSVFRDLQDIYNAEVIVKEKGFWVIKCILR